MSAASVSQDLQSSAGAAAPQLAPPAARAFEQMALALGYLLFGDHDSVINSVAAARLAIADVVASAPDVEAEQRARGWAIRALNILNGLATVGKSTAADDAKTAADEAQRSAERDALN